MATLEEIGAALIKADAAGNTADAKILADAYRALQAQQGGGAPAPPADQYGDQPNLNFGLGSSDTLNPFPAISSLGNNLASNIPIVGPYLEGFGENVDAGFANWWNGMGLDGGGGKTPTVTPQDIAARNAEIDRQNPIAATSGKIGGAVLPYVAAAGVPLLNAGLGMTGPMLQRFIMTGLSQMGINTGDNMARKGQNMVEAAGDAVMPSALSMPFAVFGSTGQALNPARARALVTMDDAGVPLTGGQATASKKMMMAESQLGGMAAQDFQEKQLSAFTKAALRSAGVTADRADREILRQAYDAAKNRFEALAAITEPRITASTTQDLNTVVGEYMQLKGVNAAPVLNTIVQRISNMAAGNGGALKGEQYKTLVTDIRRFSEKSSDDFALKGALGDIRELLDDAVEQTMGGKTLDAWRQLRREYRNLIVVTDSVSGRSEMALQGFIEPQALAIAVSNNVGRRNFAKGYGDLNKLASDGALTMAKLPDSGTASRNAALSIGGLGTPAGIISYFASGGNLGAGLGAAGATMGAAALPYLAGRALLSPPGRAIIRSGGSNVPSAVARGLLPMLGDEDRL